MQGDGEINALFSGIKGALIPLGASCMYGECANHSMCNTPCTGLSSCLLVLVEHVITSFITPPSLLPDKVCVCIPDFNCAVKPLFFEFQRAL